MSFLKRILVSLFSLFSFFTTAQVTFQLSKFPKNYQLIPRNPETNIGTYNIVGTVARSSNISNLQARVWKDSVLERSYILNVPTNVENFSFSIPVAILAELKNHKIELIALKNNQEVLLAKAENIVAGDVFIINGQSNCIGRTEPVDYDSFMRSYTNDFGWNDINYTSPSKWAPRMAKKIIETERIPVAIFCEAYGGVTQTWFMRRAINPYTEGNYGILYDRLKNAEVEKKVRAILWWQGESDGWETPLDSFKNQFKRLCSQWKEDYNAPIFYFQIRFRACTHIKPAVFEAQRQLANEIPDIEILSSNPALSYDGCHFSYFSGYDSIGIQAYNLLSAKLYSHSFVNTRPPAIIEAFFSARNEITLKMKNVVGNLRTIGNPWADFRLEGCKAQISNGTASDYRIKLNFSGDTMGFTGISYLCHIDSFSQNWIVNPLGVGMLLFYNLPVHKTQLTSTSPNPFYTEGGYFEITNNITTDVLDIHFLTHEKTQKRLSVVNMQGQIVLSQTVDIQIEWAQLPVQNLTKGMYFINLSVENQAISPYNTTSKFIKL